MKMRTTVSLFILLFTGYLWNSKYVTGGTPSPHTLLQTSGVLKNFPTETVPPGNFVSEPRLSTLLVAVISIVSVFLLILLITGVWCAWKKSNERLAQANSVPSGEPGLFLRRISTREAKSV